MSFVMVQTQGIGGIQLMESGHLENQEKEGTDIFTLFNTDRHLYYTALLKMIVGVFNNLSYRVHLR